MSMGAFVLAKTYITYRYTRELVRKSNTTDESILSLIEFTNEEIKQENSAWCFYYTYVVSKTKEVDARPGGHCAIIIRVENEYCEDLSRLYQLLKQLFDAKIRNVFIDRNNKVLRPKATFSVDDEI